MKSNDFSSALWTLDKNIDFLSEGVPGTLLFTGKSLKLTIPIGCLLERTPVNGVIAYGAEPIKADKAFGFCQSGERITLTDLSTFGPSFSTSGTKRENLQAASALLCKTDFVSPNPNIQSLTLQISGLWYWTGANLGDIESIYEKNKWVETSGVWRSDDFKDLPLF